MAKQSKKLHNAFTDEHLEIIKKVYPDTPNKVIATMIPHSATSISKKAHTMGLKKTKEHISKNGRAIARCRTPLLPSVRKHTPWD